MTGTMDPDVFVRYSRRNDEQGWVTLIAKELEQEVRSTEARSLKVFIDHRDSPSGRPGRSSLRGRYGRRR